MQTRVIQFSASMLEAGNGQDTPSTVATYVESLIEAANAADTPSNIATLNFSITEAGNAQELSSVISGNVWPVAITEVGVARDYEDYRIQSVTLMNGTKLVYHPVPLESDMKLKVDDFYIGIPIIDKTDGAAGAIRVKKNGVTKSLVHA